MSPTSSTISTPGGIQRHDASYLHDLEFDDDTIGMALSSPLFIQEREDAAGSRQAYHSFEESLLPSQSLSDCHVRTGDPYMNLVRQVQAAEKNQVATQKMSESGFFLNDKKEQILADFRAEIQKHEFQADYDRRSIQKLNGIIESQPSEINHALQEMNNFDDINNFFMNSYWNKIENFVKLMRKDVRTEAIPRVHFR